MEEQMDVRLMLLAVEANLPQIRQNLAEKWQELVEGLQRVLSGLQGKAADRVAEERAAGHVRQLLRKYDYVRGLVDGTIYWASEGVRTRGTKSPFAQLRDRMPEKLIAQRLKSPLVQQIKEVARKMGESEPKPDPEVRHGKRA